MKQLGHGLRSAAFDPALCHPAKLSSPNCVSRDMSLASLRLAGQNRRGGQDTQSAKALEREAQVEQTEEGENNNGGGVVPQGSRPHYSRLNRSGNDISRVASTC